MKVVLAQNYGFCFGVKRAIKIAESHQNAITLGPLIHNAKEIDRLKMKFGVDTSETFDDLDKNRKLIVRTHGIQKQDLENLKSQNFDIIDATCPFVQKPQAIAQEMSEQGYQVIIFGDKEHPEVRGVVSYARKENQKSDEVAVVANMDELKNIKLYKKIALISQTTKQPEIFAQIAAFLSTKTHEVRVFNTICNATFDNQSAANDLSKNVDVMIVVGGKNSSNTRQLFKICEKNCPNSYLIEDKSELKKEWFDGKNVCGITAGASTPDWIIDGVKNAVENVNV